jgi:hypothetical protein
VALQHRIFSYQGLFSDQAGKPPDKRGFSPGQMRHEIVASQEGIEISFTGEKLNQDDHDNFMQLVKPASGRPLGETVVVPANAILRTLGRSTGKSQHEQLRADMDRLISGTVTIKFDNKVIHRIAMALLLDRYACNETRLAGSSFAAEER